VLETDETIQRALEHAYAYLNKRERTEAEVRRRLEQRGLDPQAIHAALDVLIDQGLLDDARFARLFVEDKRQLDQWGSERIRRTLIERGIERDVVEAALKDRGDSDTEDGPSELDRALALLRQRFAAPPVQRRDRDRALGVLIRKGYDSELALDALTAYARDTPDAPDDALL
jgi:regulatory protein